MPNKKKENRGGARPNSGVKIDKRLGVSKGYNVTLHEEQHKWLVKKYGKLTAYMRSLLPDELK